MSVFLNNKHSSLLLIKQRAWNQGPWKLLGLQVQGAKVGERSYTELGQG